MSDRLCSAVSWTGVRGIASLETEQVDIRVRVKGGGHTSQVYAIRQAIAKAVVAYYAKYVDAFSAMELKKKLVGYDRSLLIADPRRAEPKKFGGHGARARRQKRCVHCPWFIALRADICRSQLPVNISSLAPTLDTALKANSLPSKSLTAPPPLLHLPPPFLRPRLQRVLPTLLHLQTLQHL